MQSLGAPKTYALPLSRATLSESQEDYLKQILLLGSSLQGLPEILECAQSVTTQALAEQMQVKPASVTGMLKKLSELNLVHYEAYKGASLTERGYLVAIEVLRHHRLIEAYLHQALGYGWEEVHAEAEKLEHHISEAFEQRIAQWLGHPTLDPHGDPIPNAQLQFEAVCTARGLCQVLAGPVVVKRVHTQDQDVLSTLKKLGLVPTAEFVVLDNTSAGVRIRFQQERLLLSQALAAVVQVEEVEHATF